MFIRVEFKIKKIISTWTHGRTLFKVVGHFQKYLALLFMYIRSLLAIIIDHMNDMYKLYIINT